MSVGKAKYLFISFLPLLILSAIVYYKIRPVENEGEKASASLNAYLGSEISKDSQRQEGPLSFSLQIKGDDYFKENVKQALKVIWITDKQDFYFIRKYVFEIRQERRTGFYFDEGIPVVAVSQNQESKGLTWLAGIIAHNAWHAYKEVSAKAAKKNKARVPELGEKGNYKLKPMIFYDGKTFEGFLEAEKEACRFQYEILKKIGAGKKEINKVLNRDNKDFSVGHDGQYFVNN